jgi:hypothetical protein
VDRRSRRGGARLPLALIGAVVVATACTIGAPASPRGPLATLNITPAPRTPTPAPTATPAGEVARAGFVAFATGKRPTYRVALRGQLRATVSHLNVRGTIDVAGADYATSTRLVFEDGTPSTVDTRWVRNVAWQRVDGARWRKRSGFPASGAVAPFQGLDAPDAVRHVSSKGSGAKARHTLEVTAGRLIDLTTVPAVNLTDEAVRKSSWTLIVDGRGRPVSGTWKLVGRGRVSSQLQEIEITLTATFSKVGASLTISAP